MTALIYVLFGLTIVINLSHGYRALVVYPMPSRSHANLGDGIVKQLLKDGNEVVYMTGYEYKNAPPNLRQIDISANSKAMPSQNLNINNILEKKIVLNDQDHIMSMMINVLGKTLEVKDVDELLSDPKEHFDVVIVEWMFSDILASLASVFNCPLIWVSPVEVNARVLRLVDEMPSPAFSADPLSSNTPPFTFKQRMEEVWARLMDAYRDYMYHDKLQAEFYENKIAPYITARGRQPPSFQEIRFNASLVLGNSHVSMGTALRIPQSYKPIGGYHIDENVKPLPEDLQKLMDSAKDGVIYFSMGSNLKSKDLPVKLKEGLLNMFGELKQTVLWKFEEDLPNTPDNVYILKWAPQPSILTHPNCRLFISHGGLLSTTETIYYGVPIIGIPVFGDQFVNVNRAEKKGFAIQVDLSTNIAKDLRVAIKKMLSTPSYKERVKELSFIFHDRPVKPGPEVAHWVHHVVETRGALHLRSPALQVPLYQRLFLDAIALVVIILLGIRRLCKCVCAMTCSKKTVDVKKKKN